MGGKLTCSNHLDRGAQFSCQVCGTLLCDDCSIRKWVRERPLDQCRACKSMLVPIDQKQVARARASLDTGSSGFLNKLPEYIGLSVHRSVLFLIGGLALLAVPLYWAIQSNIHPVLAILGLAIMKGLEASMYLTVISQTADDKDDVSPPEFSSLAEDVYGPLWRYLMATLPIIVGVVWFGDQIGSILGGLVLFTIDPRLILDHEGPLLLVAIGIGLLPLLTIIAAYSQSALAVLNPRNWVETLRVLGFSYVVACVVFYAILAFEIWGMVPLYLRLRVQMDVPVLTSLIIILSSYLFMMVRARILGGLVRPYLSQLG